MRLIWNIKRLPIYWEFREVLDLFLGLRSSGKTTVGKALASQLNWDFFDTDQVLVDQEGKSISDLFAIIGESRFRFLETQCLFGLPPYNLVLSTGGGMIENLKECDILSKGQLAFISMYLLIS